MLLFFSLLFFLLYIMKAEIFLVFLSFLVFAYTQLYKNAKLKYLDLFVVLVAIFSFLFSLLTPYESIFFKLSFLFYLMIIYFLFSYRERVNYINVNYFLLVGFRFNSIFFILMYISSNVLGVEYRLVWEMLPFGVSVNYYLSMYIVLIVYTYLSSSNSLDKTLLLISPLLILMIESRVILVVLLSIFIVFLIKSLRNQSTLFSSLICISLAFCLFFLNDINVIFSELVYKFSDSRLISKGVESPRFDMVNEYLNGLGALDYIFGGDFRTSPTIMQWDYNPHNSIIRAHSSFGFLGIIYIAIYLTVLFIALVNLDRTISALLLYFSVIFARALFDSVMMFTIVDLVLVLSILTLFHKKSC